MPAVRGIVTKVDSNGKGRVSRGFSAVVFVGSRGGAPQLPKGGREYRRRQPCRGRLVGIAAQDQFLMTLGVHAVLWDSLLWLATYKYYRQNASLQLALGHLISHVQHQ